MSYGLHEREVMMDIKYSGKGYLARKMGDVMFDRMEVLESTAHSILNSKSIGEIVHISSDEITDLKKAFNLAD